ncbi:MAG TPA: hypothetical protein VHT97_00955 [Acidimicrobiales bacterium]|jgi:hypothetical protein|nr:hypothetical protein [Acidimicrobiales bacterium]
MRRNESGQVAGIEAIPFGLLTFVVGALLVANAWAVIDAKIAVSAAAREATRAYAEAPVDGDPLALADAAARDAIQGAGRDPGQLVLTPIEATFARCERVTFQASYRIPAIRLPWLGGFGEGFTASARHSEIVDPYRTGLPETVNGCAFSG